MQPDLHSPNDDSAPSGLTFDELSHEKLDSLAAMTDASPLEFEAISRLLKRQQSTRLMSLTPDQPHAPGCYTARWTENDGGQRQSAVRLIQASGGLCLDFATLVPKSSSLRLLNISIRPQPFKSRTFSVSLADQPRISKDESGRGATHSRTSSLTLHGDSGDQTESVVEIEAEIRWQNPSRLHVLITNDADIEDLQNEDCVDAVLDVRGIWSADHGFENRSVRVRLTRNRSGQLRARDVPLDKPTSPNGYVSVTLRPLTVTDVHLLDGDEDPESVSDVTAFLAENNVRVCRTPADAANRPHSGLAVQMTSNYGDNDFTREEPPVSMSAGRVEVATDRIRFFLTDDDTSQFRAILCRGTDGGDGKNGLSPEEASDLVDALINFLPKAQCLIDSYRQIRNAGRADDMLQNFLLRVLRLGESSDQPRNTSNPDALFRFLLRATCVDWIRKQTGSQRRNQTHEVVGGEIPEQASSDEAAVAKDLKFQERVTTWKDTFVIELPGIQQRWWILRTEEGLKGQELENAMRPTFPEHFFTTPLPNGELRTLSGTVRTIREKTKLSLLYCGALERLQRAAESRPALPVSQQTAEAFRLKYVKGWKWDEVELHLNLTDRQRTRLMKPVESLVRTEAVIIELAADGHLSAWQFDFAEAWLIHAESDDRLCHLLNIDAPALERHKQQAADKIATRMKERNWVRYQLCPMPSLPMPT